MTPYFETELGKLYHGDCLEILPGLEPVDSLITDPVWPNNAVEVFKDIDPYRLLNEALPLAKCKRMAIHLGCDSDVRILTAVPDRFEFIRSCWLRYPVPHFKGRILYGSDLVYIFGVPPKSKKGKHLIPGEYIRTDSNGRTTDFPCERPLPFVKWIVNVVAENSVIDPFLGSGTTAVACEYFGLEWIGIEIEEKYCEIAAKRIEQERKQLKLF